MSGSVLEDIGEGIGDVATLPARAVRAVSDIVKGPSDDRPGFTPTPKSAQQPLVPVPTPDTAADNANEAAREERQPRAGRASTILTGGQGILDDEDGRFLSRRVLLGS